MHNAKGMFRLDRSKGVLKPATSDTKEIYPTRCIRMYIYIYLSLSLSLSLSPVGKATWHPFTQKQESSEILTSRYNPERPTFGELHQFL